MLTIMYPELLGIIKDLHGGILPIKIGNDFKLILKVPKEFILTAKINNGFQIFLTEIRDDKNTVPLIISTFYDDKDEPLVIKTPLFEEKLSYWYKEFLLQDKCEVHFFNENNYELLSCSAEISKNDICSRKVEELKFIRIEDINSRMLQIELNDWFILDKLDQNLKLELKFIKDELLSNYVILDASASSKEHVTDNLIYHTQLEREEPGAFQETEIVKILGRVFESDNIFLNPLRLEDGEEIADIMIITNSEILVIQAKDSPNTEELLSNTLERKKSKAIKHLSKAIRQYEGAVKYLSKSPILNFKIGNESFTHNIDKKNVYSLIVIKELFLEDYEKYSEMLLPKSNQLNKPCIFLDFIDLHKFSMVCKGDKKSFLGLYDRIYTLANKNKIFAKTVVN